MPNLLAMCFEGELSPAFELLCLRPGRQPPDGWGLGHYPGGEPSASVWKEPAPPSDSVRSLLVATENLESSVFVMHIRTATWGQLTDANTQPFSRSYRQRDWLFAHSGSLRYRLQVEEDPRFEPVGSTDTELIFCQLLTRLARTGERTLGDLPADDLRAWFDELNAFGSLSNVLTDGRDVCVYADRNGEGPLYVAHVVPPYGTLAFGDADLEVNLTKRDVKSRKGVLVSSSPLEARGGTLEWKPMEPGKLIVLRQGALTAEALPPRQGPRHPTARPPAGSARAVRSLPERQEAQKLRVHHRTVYAYDKAVERSTHLLRLFPAYDRLQRVLGHELTVSIDGRPVAGAQRDFEDVFGNRARRVLIETPYRELAIQLDAEVELLETEPFEFRPLHARSAIPLVWMPWQRHMLQPFLLPVELPETQLEELTEYAMSFVERNDYDLVETLLDLNTTIFKEYKYQQGTTTLATTPFETYTNRRGVCQDFTNLFMCLARLLGVPARYVCGYVYTRPKSPNPAQSEASHAWTQVYLPEVGWKGFDPTNGILTLTDHIRVAVGRNYVDATPTSGTIYVGGGTETLEVAVKVEIMGPTSQISAAL